MEEQDSSSFSWIGSDNHDDASSSSAGCNLNAGDTAFMMFAATVVMMQTPAMGMAQAGMIRRKNALSMLMQVLFGMVIGSLLWATVGFSLSFGPSINYKNIISIGDPFHHFGLRNVPVADCLPELADSIPASLFCAFHMMVRK
jgi:ammonium transporter, Amt family